MNKLKEIFTSKQCPDCHTPLRIIKRSGIKMWVCYSCQGVWFDRNELQKLFGGNNKSGPDDSLPCFGSEDTRSSVSNVISFQKA